MRCDFNNPDRYYYRLALTLPALHETAPGRNVFDE
jgi:hypothetical protein